MLTQIFRPRRRRRLAHNHKRLKGVGGPQTPQEESMDLNKVADAERYLAALETDYKNWQASKATVGELLQLVREGSKEVGELNKTKERLEGEIKALEQQLKNGLEGNE